MNMEQHEHLNVSLVIWVVFLVIVGIAMTAQCVSLYRARAARLQESADKLDLTSVHGSVAGTQVNV